MGGLFLVFVLILDNNKKCIIFLYIFYLEVLRILLKVMKVVTEHKQWPSQNNKKRPQGPKKPWPKPWKLADVAGHIV